MLENIRVMSSTFVLEQNNHDGVPFYQWVPILLPDFQSGGYRQLHPGRQVFLEDSFPRYQPGIVVGAPHHALVLGMSSSSHSVFSIGQEFKIFYLLPGETPFVQSLCYGGRINFSTVSHK